MPDGEELEQIVTEQIDRERMKDAILKFEIESLQKAVGQVENVSGSYKGAGRKQAD